MANGIVSIVPESGTLQRVTHAQSNVLHDVDTLLGALQSSLEALDTNEDIDHLFRLAQMARDKVIAAVAAFDRFI